MGFGRCKSCEAYRLALQGLLAQLSDKDELTLKLVQAHAEERKSLIEQLLAATKPTALGVLHPNRVPERLQGPPPRPNFPGLRRDQRPPVPPPQLRESGEEPASGLTRVK